MTANTKSKILRLKKPAALLLAVCFVLVSVLSLAVSAESLMGRNGRRIPDVQSERSEDYRKWAQADSRWGHLPMGTSGKTVARIGCLVTSVTKVLIQAGFKDSNTFNVGTYVVWLNSHGGLGSTGNFIWVPATQIADGFNYYNADYTEGSSSSSSMQNRILNYLRSGYHIVLNVKNGGHWVAVDRVKSLANNKVYIMDSLNNPSGNADILLSSRYSWVSRISLFTGTGLNSPNPAPTPTPAPAPTPTPAPDYLEQCESEIVSVQARVTAQTATLYTQPCASGNGSAVAGSASNGSILDLSAQVVNTSGENWYRVDGAGGQQSYVSLQSVEFAGFVNDLEITSQNPPSGSLPAGSGFSLREIVTSSHRLTSLTGRFTDQNGSVVKSVTVNPNTRGSFSVSSSQINTLLRFGELPVGHYNYELIAEVTADSNMTTRTETFRAVFVSPFSIGTGALSTHTVTFVDSVTNSTIGTQTVAHGFYPVMIDPPEHEGCTFSHWQGAGQRIYSDTQITAIYSTGGVLAGDADGNGTVNITDAIVVLRYALGIMNNNGGIVLASADMDGNGTVTVSDAVTVLRMAMM